MFLNSLLTKANIFLICHFETLFIKKKVVINLKRYIYLEFISNTLKYVVCFITFMADWIDLVDQISFCKFLGLFAVKNFIAWGTCW